MTPYLFYNALVAAFAVAVYLESARGTLFKLGLAALVLNSIAGALMVSLFPEDPGGLPTTPQGTGHLAFAGVSVLCTLAIALVHGVAFRPVSRTLATISFAIGVGILVFGPLAAVATAAQSDLAGRAERVPIALFLGWVAAVSAYALRFGAKSGPIARMRTVTHSPHA